MEMQVSSALPLLPPGGSAGTLIGFSPESEQAEFEITCGWDTRTHRSIRPGLWRLSLRGATFGIEVGPLDPDGSVDLAAGHNVAVTKGQWERYVLSAGFSGFIITFGTSPLLTDGTWKQRLPRRVLTTRRVRPA